MQQSLPHTFTHATHMYSHVQHACIHNHPTHSIAQHTHTKKVCNKNILKIQKLIPNTDNLQSC